MSSLTRTTSVLLLAAACGGAAVSTPAVDIRAGVEAPEELVCAFEGSFYGTLRFGDVDERVEARTANARLFASRLEVHASGGGWHLFGHSDLSVDHVLRLQEAMWFGEGVAVARRQHVSVRAGEVGRVFVRPHPFAVESVVTMRSLDQGVGCEAVGLTDEDTRVDYSALELPPLRESTGFSLPLSLSHAPNESPFVEVQHRPAEVRHRAVPAWVLERQGDWVRVIAQRHGRFSRSEVSVVGWLLASRLDGIGWHGGIHFAGQPFDVDHLKCEAPSVLPLFIEGPSGRVEAGRIDGETPFVVDARDESWAVVRPLGNELRLTRDRRFFVPSATLQCTSVAGTHVRQLHRVRVRASGLACGGECDCSLLLATPHKAEDRCQARLWCGDELVFGDWSMGQFDCRVREGGVSGADTEPSDGSLGNPRFSIDGDTITASDDPVGRLGAFHLEGRIVR